MDLGQYRADTRLFYTKKQDSVVRMESAPVAVCWQLHVYKQAVDWMHSVQQQMKSAIHHPGLTDVHVELLLL